MRGVDQKSKNKCRNQKTPWFSKRDYGNLIFYTRVLFPIANQTGATGRQLSIIRKKLLKILQFLPNVYIFICILSNWGMESQASPGIFRIDRIMRNVVDGHFKDLLLTLYLVFKYEGRGKSSFDSCCFNKRQ